MMVLIDRLLVGGKTSINLLMRRYLPLAAILIPYLAFELTLASNTLYKTNLGYGLGVHIFSTLGEYLSRLVFPWGAHPPLDYLWLFFVLSGIAYLIIRRRDRQLLFLVIGTVLIVAPYLPFQFVFPRFLYLPTMFPAVAIGSAIVGLYQRFASQQWTTLLAVSGVVGIVLVNGFQTMQEIVALERFARECRVPLRTISQRYSTFPPNTLLYFIDPPVPLYSGMFYLKYGPLVSVGGDIGIYDSLWKNIPPQPANLRRYDTAYVFSFENGKLNEHRVSQYDTTTIEPIPPIDFESHIQLEGYEIVNNQIKRNGNLVVLLYWKAKEQVVTNYTVFAHLLDQNGNIVAGVDSQPRHGKMPTSSWRINERVVDWIILPILEDIAAGTNYRLVFGLYDLSTMQRLGVIDTQGNIFSDRVIIGPITIE